MKPVSDYYGLIEITFFEVLVLAFACYELWTVRKYLLARPKRKPLEDVAASSEAHGDP